MVTSNKSEVLSVGPQPVSGDSGPIPFSARQPPSFQSLVSILSAVLVFVLIIEKPRINTDTILTSQSEFSAVKPAVSYHSAYLRHRTSIGQYIACGRFTVVAFSERSTYFQHSPVVSHHWAIFILTALFFSSQFFK